MHTPKHISNVVFPCPGDTQRTDITQMTHFHTASETPIHHLSTVRSTYRLCVLSDYIEVLEGCPITKGGAVIVLYYTGNTYYIN